jgi:predicted transcriptional regulator
LLFLALSVPLHDHDHHPWKTNLKARVAAAAEREGKTTHAFILEAIAQTVEQAELDEEFRRQAEERWQNVLRTGKTVPWIRPRHTSRRGPEGIGTQADCPQASALTSGMARIELAPEVFDDFDRFFDHLAEARRHRRCPAAHRRDRRSPGHPRA